MRVQDTSPFEEENPERKGIRNGREASDTDCVDESFYGFPISPLLLLANMLSSEYKAILTMPTLYKPIQRLYVQQLELVLAESWKCGVRRSAYPQRKKVRRKGSSPKASYKILKNR